MAPTNRQIQFSVSCNASQPKKEIEALKKLEEDLIHRRQQLIAQGETEGKNWNQVKTALRDVRKEIRSAEDNYETLQKVIADLSNSSLPQLKKAFKEGQKAISQMSENNANLKPMQAALQEIQRQMDFITGKAKNVAKEIDTLDTKTDGWLASAKRDLKAYADSLDNIDDHYKEQVRLIQLIEAEEEKRKMKISATEASTMASTGKRSQTINGTTSFRNASINEMQQGRKVLQEARDASTDIVEIERLNKEIVQLDERMKALVSTEQQVFRISGQTAQKVREVLRNPQQASGNDIKYTIEQLQKRMMELPAGSKAVAGLRRNVEMLQKTLKGVTENIVDVNDVMARSKQGKATIDELKRAYKQLEEELQHIKTSDPGFKQKQKDAQQLKKQIDEVTGAAKSQSSAFKTTLKNISAYFGVFQLFSKAQSLITGVIKKNFEYSSSLTDIRKVSGLTEASINDLSRALAKIDTRTSVEGLAQLAYQGSKLGMSKYGVEGLTQFVRAADQINVAIGEEMGEEALPALSKLVETMGVIPKLGIEKAMLATGSAMFKLSTTSTATSNNIVEMARRLTGVSRTAGITTDQMLALASASDSLFLMPEVSATAFSKFIVALQKNHNIIEKDLGIQEGTIKNLYSAGKAMDAIVLVLEKMRDKGNMNALGGIFKDLGSDGQRLVTAMVTMSKNVDVLKDHLYESQQAFEEATAVTAEYKMQQESAIGILERANNLWTKAFVNPDGVDNVKSMAQAWYDMSNMMLNSPIYKGTFNASLQAVIGSVKLLVVLLPVLMNYFVSLGAIKAVGAIWELGKAIRAAVVAQQALNTAVKINPYAALASVIMTVVGVVWSYANAAKEAAAAEAEAEKKANAWKSKLKDAQTETDSLTRKLHSFKTALEQTGLSQQRREQEISRFNKEFRSYINKLGIEIKNVKDLKTHYNELATEIQRATYYRLREQAKADAMPKFQKDRLDAENRIKDYINTFKNSYGGFTPKGIMEMFAKGANATWVYQQMIKGANKNVDKNGITFDNKTGAYSYTTTSGAKVSSAGAQDLLSALRHYQNATARERNKEKEINDYFGDFVPEDYHPWTDDEPGTLENEAPDKEAIKAAKAAALAQAKEWRQQLKEAQSDANAIIDKIKNYYERQILEVTEKANSLNLDEAQTEALTRPIRAKMNDALAVARKAISNVEQGWDTFKQTMQDDMIEVMGENGLNESQMLLDQIEKADLKALQEKIAALSKSLNRPESALMDQIWRNATKNAQANADAERKQREEIQKILLEHNYTGIVDNNTTQQMEKIGAFGLSAKQVQTLLGGKEGEAEALLAEREEQIKQLLENARANIVDILSSDLDKEGGRDKFLTAILGDKKDWEENTSQLSAILNMDKENLKAFFYELIKYNDEYDAAQKKSDDERKKLNDYSWSKTAYATQYSKDMVGGQQYNDIMGGYRNAGERMGMANIAEGDPELEMMKARMGYAERYYQYLKEHNATEQQLADARKGIMDEQAAYAKKLTADMFEQYNALLNFINPLEQFGASVGDAFATMTEDAAAGRKAIKDALKQMIKSFATNTLQMISQQQIDRANTTAHYTELLLIQQAFAQAQLDAEIANGVAMIQAKQATNLSEEQLEGIHQQVMAALKSAGIFGWCVSALGPIAGPIAYGAMMSILMGLLNFAIGKIGGGSDAKSADVKGPNTKVVSGMLTYDNGNVQDLKPFFDKDGNMYWATEDHKNQHSGISLYDTPTATTINGKPSLVAENGPELVIGRETTASMMQNNPALLKALYLYDKNHSGRIAYDRGNIAEAGASFATVPDASASGSVIIQRDPEMLALMSALLQRLNEPIKAKIDMYGRGNLYDSMNKASAFMKNK